MGILSAEERRKLKEQRLRHREYYLLRSILGYDWAIFTFLLGGREAGKSYATTKFFVKQFLDYGRPFYWLRLTDGSHKKLLTNNAEKLIDPDIRREYNLDITTNGENVYVVTQRDSKGKIKEKKLMARVMCLSTFIMIKVVDYLTKIFLMTLICTTIFVLMR